MGDTVENYIKECPNQQQVKMMNAWLQNNQPGTFRFTGFVDPTDGTVITPQATVDYGYNWFSLTEGPAIIRTLLIPNAKKIYDRTTYTSEQNADGTYTVTLSPAGDGLKGIPTGKPFYAILRAYVPVQGADMTVRIEKR